MRAAATAGIGEGDLTVPLTNRVPLAGQGAAAGEALYYRLDVPANVGSLTLRTYGGAGDVSLYVPRGYVPTASSYDAASTRPGTTEALVLNKPAAGSITCACRQTPLPALCRCWPPIDSDTPLRICIGGLRGGAPS